MNDVLIIAIVWTHAHVRMLVSTGVLSVLYSCAYLDPELRIKISKLEKEVLFLIVIFISAGVGRSGTLITIDIALAQAAREGIIDIAGIVGKIRSQRMKMVQSPVRTIFPGNVSCLYPVLFQS